MEELIVIKILFLCHGNICRSPLAEFIMKDLVNKEELTDKYFINSKALSDEEIGNDIYPDSKRCLDKHHIPYNRRRASKFTKEDYEYYDYIYLMDESNKRLINRIIEDKDHKIKMLNGIIEDPWYTGNFDKVFNEIYEGCLKILKEMEK